MNLFVSRRVSGGPLLHNVSPYFVSENSKNVLKYLFSTVASKSEYANKESEVINALRTHVTDPVSKRDIVSVGCFQVQLFLDGFGYKQKIIIIKESYSIIIKKLLMM